MTAQETTAPDWPYHQPAQRLDVRGLDVAYRRQGDGVPVLYLHGLRMTRRWLPFYEALARHGDLIVPEHPGFGETPMPDWLDGMDDFVFHYAELIEALGLERFHLVGCSFGGWLAAEIAVYYPERLRSLTLIAPMGLRVPGHAPLDLFRLSPDGFGDALFNGRGGDYADYLREGDDAETVFQSYAEMTAFAKAAWNPRYDRKLDRRLGRVRAPALVVAAQEDRVVPTEHAERYAQLLGDARLVTAAGTEVPTGHGMVAQEPDVLADLVAAHIAGEGPRP